MIKETSSSSSLSKHALGMIGILVVEYLLGMYTTLFVSFPEKEAEKQLWQFAWKAVPIALHIIVGLLLFLGTLALLIRAAVKKDKQWIISATISAVAIFGAVIGGAIFVPTQKEWYSFLMAISFIIALLSYFWGVYASKD